MEKLNLETQENRESPIFNFEMILRKFNSGDSSLILNGILKSIKYDTNITFDEGSWISKTKRDSAEDGSKHATILVGVQKNPANIESLFAWGTRNKEEEKLIKIAHEVSHAFQYLTEYDSKLVSFLDGENNIPEKFIAYIRLYASLSSFVGVTGLSTLSIYHGQNRETGVLNISVLEDVTELLAAYSLGNEYLQFRLDNSYAAISDKQKIEIKSLIKEVFDTI